MPKLLRRNASRLCAKTVSVAEKQNMLALSLGLCAGLNPLAHASTAVESSDEAKETTFDIRAVVLAHDGANGVGSLVGIIKGDRADVVVQDVSLDDAVEEVTANEAHLTVNGGSGATNIVPLFGGVVRQGRVGVLEEGNGDWKIRLVSVILARVLERATMGKNLPSQWLTQR
jgi:hypothetical protein